MKKLLCCCCLVAVSLACLAGDAHATLELKLDGITIFNFAGNYYTYDGTYAGPTAGPVGFGIEVQGTSSPIVGPDPENYGLVVSADYGDEIPVASYNAPYTTGVPNATVADITTTPPFSNDAGQAEWALSYSNDSVNPIPNPYHSVLFGGLPILFDDPGTFGGLTGPGNELYFRDDLGNDGPGGIPDRLDISLTLDSDGTYHSVNAELAPTTNFEFPLTALSDLLAGNITEAQFFAKDWDSPTNPGVLTLMGSVFEVGIDANGRNVWSTTAIPEPSSVLLIGALVGLVGAGKVGTLLVGRRRGRTGG